MSGHIVNRYSPEELKDMTADEVNAAISRDIREDAYKSQEQSPVRYCGKTPAEHLEKVLYLCPNCHGLATLHSRGSDFFCDCGLFGSYDEYGRLEGDAFSFRTVTEWFIWQREFLPKLAWESGFSNSRPGQQLICVSNGGAFTAAEGLLTFNRESLNIAGNVFPLSEISELSIHGGSVLVFFHRGIHYEIKSPYPRSALLYQDLFHLFKENSPGGNAQV